MRWLIEEADVAFWLRLTTSKPPNCRCLQSVRTDSPAGPLKPTIITAPTSSSRVKPPGPSCAAGSDGAAAGGGLLEEAGVSLNDPAADDGRHAGSNAESMSSRGRRAEISIG